MTLPKLTGDSPLNGDAKIILAVLQERMFTLGEILKQQIDELKRDVSGHITAVRIDIQNLETKVDCNHVDIKTMQKDVDANTKLRDYIQQQSLRANVQMVLTLGVLVAVIVKIFT